MGLSHGPLSMFQGNPHGVFIEVVKGKDNVSQSLNLLVSP